ncbi:response regulator transcription factor [Leekyejoonella antrihumi]|uniref:Response regulator transcription factor n=1 Tax=Leekyejoonella antrihumi TaxID=1660198 RepID=A0A563E6Z1_9MICO|nr:response regulator transcription factor [Leekyejoonella antrihumi]TWP38267.1 response regulator transcription factor [Leekyejoonella antrihumi]
MTITVVLTEDNFLVREGVRRMISASTDIQVLAACADLDAALRTIDDLVPQVVLTDIRMPPSHSNEGLTIAQHCRSTHPSMGVLLLSQYIEPGYVKQLLTQGTEGRGYLLKERVGDLDELTGAIRAVAAGGSAIDPKVVESLVRGKTRAGDPNIARLTPRERQVLAGVAEGRTNAAISADLVISQHAVEKHINSIFSKLGLTDGGHIHPRVGAALMYLAEGRH